MDTHLYADRKASARVTLETAGTDSVIVKTRRYNPETGEPVDVPSDPVSLDDLYARREAAQRDLDSLNALIADAEAAIGSKDGGR
mgnify:CR=1 FL=1|jgi:hypothetical protein